MRSTFLRRWILAVTAGEATGFLIPAAAGGMVALTAAPTWTVYPVMIGAGACEGALLGLGQSLGFGPSVVPRAAWVTATAAGAAVAWSIGMLPSTLAGFDPGSPGALPEVFVGAVLLLVSIPTLQWLVCVGSCGGVFAGFQSMLEPGRQASSGLWLRRGSSTIRLQRHRCSRAMPWRAF